MLESVLASAPEPKRVIWEEGEDHFFAGIPQSPASKLGTMNAGIRLWLAEEFGL